MAQPSKVALELPLVLPDITGPADHCVARLTQALDGRPGLEHVHVKESPNLQPQLCVHYDPSLISLSRLREIVHTTGASISDTYGHYVAKVEPMHARRARQISDDLRALDGVVEAEASSSGSLRIEYLRKMVSEPELVAAISSLTRSSGTAGESKAVSLGGPQEGHVHGEEKHAHQHDAKHEHGREHEHDHAKAGGKEHDHEHEHGGIFGQHTELIFAGLAGALVLAGWLLEKFAALPSWLTTSIYVGAYFCGGYFTTLEALENLRKRRFEIDTLMLVAAVGAAALGQWAEGALLLFLFSLGHSLEHFAMGRARKAIEALAELAPETAHLKRGNALEDVPVQNLKPGDIVVVKPNERLPADGIVVAGTSSVNQAPVTGESVPVDKSAMTGQAEQSVSFDKVPAAHRVFTGTINGSGALEVRVSRPANESTMARVVKMVTEAEAQRSPTQQMTDKFERIFVPAVLCLVVLLMGACLVINEPFSASFYRAMAVLVAASPCALAISVPSAVLSGIARAGRGGVLIKGGAPLENLGTLTAIAFDKTGTLTAGKPAMTDLIPAPGVSADELLAVLIAIESHSDHPLATAVVDAARKQIAPGANIPQASDVTSITGRGVQGMIDGERVYVAKPVFFKETSGMTVGAEVEGANEKLVQRGRTTMIASKGSRMLGVVGLMDQPREVVPGVMSQLRGLNVTKLIMISGDNQQVADAVAKAVGLTEARGDLMPEDKVEVIKSLREKDGKVAMVGDGVNDAPAMANATVGIAMGAAGSDVALEAADVALMADDLRQLPFAVGLSRRTSRIIKQNLWVSLGVVAVLIPATIFGLNIGTAVLFHEGSTLVVVFNALRLLAYQLPDRVADTAIPPGKTQAPVTALK